MRHFLYLVYLWPCLALGLVISDLCDLFFIFIFMFIITNQMISLKWAQLFFCTFFRICTLFLDDNTDEESKQFSNSKFSSSASEFCLVVPWFFANFNLVLLKKVLSKKKHVLLSLYYYLLLSLLLLLLLLLSSFIYLYIRLIFILYWYINLFG